MDIQHIEGFDCIDDNLAIILKSYSLDIRKTFSKLWYFEMANNDNLLGNRLMLSNINKYLFLEQNFNIKYNIFENLDRNKEIQLKNFGTFTNVNRRELDKIIRENNLLNNIIIVEVDTFKYKYDKGFNKYIGTHSCIITNINNKNVSILDVWYNLKDAELSYEELLDCTLRVIILDMSNIKEKELNNRELKENLLSNTSVDLMKEFFKELPNINIEKEYNNLDFELVFKAPIDKALRKIIMNRQRYTYYLTYLSEQLNNKQLEQIAQDLFNISIEWTKIRNILMQTYFLKKNINKTQLNDIAFNILENELKIRNRIEGIKW